MRKQPSNLAPQQSTSHCEAGPHTLKCKHFVVRILYQNVRGLNTKLQKAACLTDVTSYDILESTETWLHSAVTNEEVFSGDRIVVLRNNREDFQGGSSRDSLALMIDNYMISPSLKQYNTVKITLAVIWLLLIYHMTHMTPLAALFKMRLTGDLIFRKLMWLVCTFIWVTMIGMNYSISYQRGF